MSAQGKGQGWGFHSTNPPTPSTKLVDVRLQDGTRALDTCGGARGKAAKQGLIGRRPVAPNRRQLHVKRDAAEREEEGDVAARRLISDVGARLDVLKPDIAIYGGEQK